MFMNSYLLHLCQIYFINHFHGLIEVSILIWLPTSDIVANKCHKKCSSQQGGLIIFFAFQNLPFQIQNKYRLVSVAFIYFASGFGLPFLLVRHQLLKKQ